jgi:hypothetical protein
VTGAWFDADPKDGGLRVIPALICHSNLRGHSALMARRNRANSRPAQAKFHEILANPGLSRLCHLMLRVT